MKRPDTNGEIQRCPGCRSEITALGAQWCKCNPKAPFRMVPAVVTGTVDVVFSGIDRTSAQVERQKFRSQKSGKYKKFFPCERCDKSCGESYYSDERCNTIGPGLVLCQKCAAYLVNLDDAAYIAEFKKKG